MYQGFLSTRLARAPSHLRCSSRPASPLPPLVLKRTRCAHVFHLDTQSWPKRLRALQCIFRSTPPESFARKALTSDTEEERLASDSRTRHPTTPAPTVVRGPVTVGAAARRAHLAHRAQLRLPSRFPRNPAAHTPSEIPVPNSVSQVHGAAAPGILGIDFRSFSSRVEERRGY
jgi:hypothetical protein